MTERTRGPEEEDFFDLGDELELDASGRATSPPPANALEESLANAARKPSQTPNRPLYRPPPPGMPGPSRPAVAKEPPRAPSFDEFDDEEEGATRIGAIPEELLRSLNAPHPGKATTRGVPAVSDEDADDQGADANIEIDLENLDAPGTPLPPSSPQAMRPVKAPYVPPPPPAMGPPRPAPPRAPAPPLPSASRPMPPLPAAPKLGAMPPRPAVAAPPRPIEPPLPLVEAPSAGAPEAEAAGAPAAEELLDPWAVDNQTAVGGGLDVSWSRLDDLGAVPVKAIERRTAAEELDDDLDVLLGVSSAPPPAVVVEAAAPAAAVVFDAESDSEPDADSEPGPDSEPESDSEPDADSEPEPGSEPDADSELDADSEPELSMGSDDDDVELEVGGDADDALFGSEPPAPLSIPALRAPKVPSEPPIAALDDPASGLDALHDAETPADGMPIVAAPTPAPEAPKAAGDRGAEAAKRTVRQRKPRTEVLPLVGTGAEAQKARVELLVALAERTEGAERARLLASAAELCERAGDARASELLSDAHRADPDDLHVLRALRREALVRGDCQEAARLLALEAPRVKDDDERALVLVHLAELELHQLGRAAEAEAHARAAQELRPLSVVASLLVAEAAGRRKDFDAVGNALASAGDAASEGPLRGSFLAEAARIAERMGAHDVARSRYERAAATDPSSLGAALGSARSLLRSPEPRGAVAMLGRARAVLEGEHEGLDRARARLLALREGAHDEAAALLSDPRAPLALLARADAAQGAGDARAAKEAYAEATAALSGRARALALLSVAELEAGDGAFAEADRALREAANADPALAIVQVVRESLARLAPDPSVLPISTQDDARQAESLSRAIRGLAERSLDEERAALDALAEALPLVYETLGLDVAAAQGDVDAVVQKLRQKADRQAPSARVGSLLALASVLEARGEGHKSEAVLREARELSPGDPLVLRPLAVAASRTAPIEAAALRLEESAASVGEASAFAATWAGRLLEKAGGDASPAYRRALHTAPGYLPAIFGLLPIVEERGARAEARELHRAAAKRIDDPRRATVHVANAIELSLDEPAVLADLVREAARLAPSDSALVELALGLEGALEPALRAALLEGAIEGATGAVKKALRVAAARAREAAGEHAAAAELYRAAVAEDGDAAAKRGLERSEIAANQLERLAEAHIRDVRAAQTDDARRRALEALAELDLHHRDDGVKAILSLESALELDPTDLATLRALERLYMDGDAGEELARIEGAMLERLDGRDAAGAARLHAALLLPTERGGAALDETWIRAARRGASEAGALRRIHGAAVRRREPGVHYEALAALAGEAADPATRLWYALRAATEAERLGKAEEAMERLAAAIAEQPGHPTANEELARLHLRAGGFREAAERFEAAAESASGAGRKARLWYAASSTWLDRVGDEERGLLALEATTRADVTYLDAYDRARDLLVARGDLPRALRLTEARIAAGGDGAQLAQLEAARADLCERLGDSEAASDALRAALELAPDDVRTLRRLAELHLRTESYASAADALIRIARKEQDREELRWVFLTLGDIYDLHLPDAKRADVAYRRVLKLSPGDAEALDRLAGLHLRSGQLQAVADAIEELFKAHPDSARARERCVDFAAALERAGDERAAEEALDRARRAAPTDIAVTRALADFYRRQNAVSALSMHLARAAADHRREIDDHPDQAKGWAGLAQILSWGGQDDASRCAAMGAVALGVRDVTLARHVDAAGNVPGARGGATLAEVEEILAPRLLPTVVRQALRFASPVLHKVVPFDAKAFRAERLRGHPLVDEAERIARELRVPDVQVLVTDLAPRICVPVSDEPAILVVGRELSSVTTEEERAFLFARALQIARTGLSIAMRVQPDQLTLLVTALTSTFDPMVRRDGVDPAQLDDVAKRIAKVMPRKLRNELEPLFLEIAGRADIDASKLGLAVADFGNRLGLLTTGALGGALSALVRLAGRELGEPDPAQRAEVLRRMPETWALLHFAISDAHFEARRRAITDRRS